MPDINHQFPIKASAKQVFDAITSPAGLNSWWTLQSKGSPLVGSSYQFFFSEEYNWSGVVVSAVTDSSIEWEFTSAEPDWTGTRLRMDLVENEGWIWVTFLHSGWAEASEHFRISSYCWATYLRLLKRYVELGEVVEYSKRDDA